MALAALKKARDVLLGQDTGTLSTHSSDCPGYPFGSIVPVGFDALNRPVLLISRLAQHTRNVAENAKASLLLSDIAQLGLRDAQTCARVTIIGEVHKLDVGQEAQTVQRYSRFYPQAERYYQELDFDFYRIEPEKVRFIAGFGQIHWIEPGQLFTENPFAGDMEVDICEHMNSDHADALQRYCQLAAVELGEDVIPVMVGVDAFGFHQRIGERIFRFDFPEPVENPGHVRNALIAMLKKDGD